LMAARDKDSLNPDYMIKYKVADINNLATATVVGVTWNVSKHGYLKPQVNIEPIELVGVTVRNATGFNAKFIYENGIGKGATITITRSGDVIPFITSVVKSSTPQMPTHSWIWNDTGVDAVVEDITTVGDVPVMQTLDFFRHIDAPHLKEGTIRKVFNVYEYKNAHTAIVGMIMLGRSDWVRVIGENGHKIYKGLKDKLNGISLHTLMGSTTFFGRGVGVRKFKKLLEGLKIQSVNQLSAIDNSQIELVPGFEHKTALKIISGLDEFVEFYNTIQDNVTLAEIKETSSGCLSEHKICMTGFRDKDMATTIVEAGGEVQSGVTGKTTLLVCKDPTSNSGKVKKAKDRGIAVISIDQMNAMFQN